MDFASAQRLKTRGAKLRQTLAGKAADGTPQLLAYDGGAALFEGYFSPLKFARQLEELNLREMHDCVVRFLKSDVAFIPAIGKKIRILSASPAAADIHVRIEEFNDHPTAVEWILGCTRL